MTMTVHHPGRFEERLLDELVAFQQSDAPSATGARRTRFPVRRIPVVAAALVAVSALLVTTQTASPPAGPGAASPQAVSLGPQTLTAMTTASRAVVFHSRVVQRSGSVSELWRDDETRASLSRTTDASGQVLWEMASRVGPDGAVERLTINHLDKTWGVREVATAPDMPDTASALQDQLQRNLASGRSKVEGTDVVDGRPATRIKTVGAKGETSVLWIDNETLLPLKQVGDSINATYSSAPRSPENLAALWPAPPAGFTKLDSLPLPPGVKLPAGFGPS
jgi:hypothetical protein